MEGERERERERGRERGRDAAAKRRKEPFIFMERVWQKALIGTTVLVVSRLSCRSTLERNELMQGWIEIDRVKGGERGVRYSSEDDTVAVMDQNCVCVCVCEEG